MLLTTAIIPVTQSIDLIETTNHFTTTPQLQTIAVEITQPEQGYLYLNNQKMFPLFLFTLIIGPITVEAKITTDQPIEKLEFYRGTTLEHTDYYPPFTWELDDTALFKQTLKAQAYSYEGDIADDELTLWMFSRGTSNPPQNPSLLNQQETASSLIPVGKKPSSQHHQQPSE